MLDCPTKIGTSIAPSRVSSPNYLLTWCLCPRSGGEGRKKGVGGRSPLALSTGLRPSTASLKGEPYRTLSVSLPGIGTKYSPSGPGLSGASSWNEFRRSTSASDSLLLKQSSQLSFFPL